MKHAVDALASSPTARYGIWTDSESSPGTVAVAVAVRGARCLITVDASEWDGRLVLPWLDASLKPANTGNTPRGTMAVEQEAS